MEQITKLKAIAKDMSILYVEDEKAIRESTVEFLKRFFNSVDSARNGKDGLELFTKYRHDIVITDIAMPVMEGQDMIAEIRKIAPLASILIVSAYDFSDFLLPKFPNGANAFLKKPIIYGDFINTLCELIENTKHQDIVESLLKKRIKSLEDRVAALEEKIENLTLGN